MRNWLRARRPEDRHGSSSELKGQRSGIRFREDDVRTVARQQIADAAGKFLVGQINVRRVTDDFVVRGRRKGGREMVEQQAEAVQPGSRISFTPPLSGRPASIILCDGLCAASEAGFLRGRHFLGRVLEIRRGEVSFHSRRNASTGLHSSSMPRGEPIRFLVHNAFGSVMSGREVEDIGAVLDDVQQRDGGGTALEFPLGGAPGFKVFQCDLPGCESRGDHIAAQDVGMGPVADAAFKPAAEAAQRLGIDLVAIGLTSGWRWRLFVLAAFEQ